MPKLIYRYLYLESDDCSSRVCLDDDGLSGAKVSSVKLPSPRILHRGQEITNDMLEFPRQIEGKDGVFDLTSVNIRDGKSEPVSPLTERELKFRVGDDDIEVLVIYLKRRCREYHPMSMTRYGSTIDAATEAKAQVKSGRKKNRKRYQEEFVENVSYDATPDKTRTAIANKLGIVYADAQTTVTAMDCVPEGTQTHKFQYWDIWALDDCDNAAPNSQISDRQLVIPANGRWIAVAIYSE